MAKKAAKSGKAAADAVEWTGAQRDKLYSLLAKGDLDAAVQLVERFPGLKVPDFAPMDKKALASLGRRWSADRTLQERAVMLLLSETPAVFALGRHVLARTPGLLGESLIAAIDGLPLRLEQNKKAVIAQAIKHAAILGYRLDRQDYLSQKADWINVMGVVPGKRHREILAAIQKLADSCLPTVGPLLEHMAALPPSLRLFWLYPSPGWPRIQKAAAVFEDAEEPVPDAPAPTLRQLLADIKSTKPGAAPELRRVLRNMAVFAGSATLEDVGKAVAAAQPLVHLNKSLPAEWMIPLVETLMQRFEDDARRAVLARLDAAVAYFDCHPDAPRRIAAYKASVAFDVPDWFRAFMGNGFVHALRWGKGFDLASCQFICGAPSSWRGHLHAPVYESSLKEASSNQGCEIKWRAESRDRLLSLLADAPIENAFAFAERHLAHSPGDFGAIDTKRNTAISRKFRSEPERIRHVASECFGHRPQSRMLARFLAENFPSVGEGVLRKANEHLRSGSLPPSLRNVEAMEAAVGASVASSGAAHLGLFAGLPHEVLRDWRIVDGVEHGLASHETFDTLGTNLAAAAGSHPWIGDIAEGYVARRRFVHCNPEYEDLLMDFKADARTWKQLVEERLLRDAAYRSMDEEPAEFDPKATDSRTEFWRARLLEIHETLRCTLSFGTVEERFTAELRPRWKREIEEGLALRSPRACIPFAFMCFFLCEPEYDRRMHDLYRRWYSKALGAKNSLEEGCLSRLARFPLFRPWWSRYHSTEVAPAVAARGLHRENTCFELAERAFAESRGDLASEVVCEVLGDPAKRSNLDALLAEEYLHETLWMFWMLAAPDTLRAEALRRKPTPLLALSVAETHVDDVRKFLTVSQDVHETDILFALLDHPSYRTQTAGLLLSQLESGVAWSADRGFAILFGHPGWTRKQGRALTEVLRRAIWNTDDDRMSPEKAITRLLLLGRHGHRPRAEVYLALEDAFQLDDPTAWRKAADAMREFLKELPHLALANPDRVRELIARDPKKHGPIFKGLVQ